MSIDKQNFVNLSNHPSSKWSEKQLNEAYKYGDIVDIDFPSIRAEAGEEEITSLATVYAEQITALQPAAVMCQGEFTFVYALVRLLTARGIPCVAACSARSVMESVDEDGNTKKLAVFEFVRFRKYG